MRLSKIFSRIYMLAIVLSVTPLAADLLVNSSFEDPAIPAQDAFALFNAGDTIGSGWTLDPMSQSAALLLRSGALGGPSTNDGGQYLLFGDGLNFGTLRQDVALNAFTSYQLSFELGAQINADGGLRVDMLRNGVSVLGGEQNFITTIGNGFQTKTLLFNSVDAGVYRLLLNASGPSSSIDAFNLVVSIPEPSTFLLVFLVSIVVFSNRSMVQNRQWSEA